LIWINRQASCASTFGSAINDTPVVVDGQGWLQVSPIFLRLARLISTSLQKVMAVTDALGRSWQSRLTFSFMNGSPAIVERPPVKALSFAHIIRSIDVEH